MNRIITIGREFGSGGREFGRRLAEELGIEYYDNEIITEVSKHTDLSEEYIQQIIENRPHSLYPITVGHTIAYVESHPSYIMQSVYKAQTEIIRDLASKSDCVIVGRCADYILREQNPYRIFVHADIESRIKRCMNRSDVGEQFTEKKMKQHILKIDKNRAKYYRFYTGREWGDKKNYELSVNTTDAVIKDIVPVFAKLFTD